MRQNDNVNVGRLPSAGVMPMPTAALYAVGYRFLIFQAVLLLIIRCLFFVLTKKTDGMLLKHAVRHYRDKVIV